MTISQPSNTQTDVLIIGGGHNALACAFYLAAKGLSVKTLERRNVIGGAAVTEEFHPGFRNSTASYTVSLLNPKVQKDMDLEKHGLKIVKRKMWNFLPLDDKQYFEFGGKDAQAEIEKFSPRDAERFSQYTKRLEIFGDFMRKIALTQPPDISGSWAQAAYELLCSPAFKEMLRIPPWYWPDAWKLFTQSAGDYLDKWFDGAPLKAALGWDSIVGNYASPYTKGSAYVLLHHVFGEVNGEKGVWGHAIGGMGAITQAMAKACEEKGVDIRLDTPVKKVLIENGRAVGVVTENGAEHRAKTVVSSLNPKLLFGGKMIDEAELPTDFREHMENWKCGSGTFRMNLALSELPNFTCKPGNGDHLTSGILIAPDLDYMKQAFEDSKKYGWSKKPVVEIVIPSTLDDTLAPPEQHVASLFCQHVAPELPDGKSWDDHKEEVAQLMIDTVNEHAPNFKKSILGVQIHSPKDLEDKFGLMGGDIMHGALSFDQLYFNRPMQGYAGYLGPLGIYMCGSGTHPGGGVTGAPGHNAAHRILKDLKLG